jgi:hypothetical protein
MNDTEKETIGLDEIVARANAVDAFWKSQTDGKHAFTSEANKLWNACSEYHSQLVREVVEALEFYKDAAEAVQRNFDKRDKLQLEPVLAILTTLALDNGRRAGSVLSKLTAKAD